MPEISAPRRGVSGVWGDDGSAAARASLTAAWLGHATVLLNLHGIRILTDPVSVPG